MNVLHSCVYQSQVSANTYAPLPMHAPHRISEVHEYLTRERKSLEEQRRNLLRRNKKSNLSVVIDPHVTCLRDMIRKTKSVGSICERDVDVCIRTAVL